MTSSRRPATPPPIFSSRKCVAKTSLPGTDHRIVKDRTGPISTSGPSILVCHRTRQLFRTTQSVSPRSPPPNRWPFARGRGPSTPGAPDEPAGCPSDAMPIRSLLSLISRNSPKRSGIVSPELYKSGPGLRLSGLAGIDKPEAQAKAISKS